jgi:hypothetical protein
VNQFGPAWKLAVFVAAVATTGCAGNTLSALPPSSPAIASHGASRTIAASHRRPGSYSALVASLSAQIASKQLSDGALLNSSTGINGYFGNYAAMGLVAAGNYAGAQRWAQWYVAHLNPAGVWGAGCTEYDYKLVNGVETSLGTAGSVDARAATFLTLLRTMYASGNPALVSYVASLHATAECVATSITSLLAPNGLTQVTPGNGNEYLMDNAQTYRGLSDAAWLESNVWNDAADAGAHAADAATISGAIAGLWNPTVGMYAAATSVHGHLETPSWKTWYADSTAQLFLVINGVLAPRDPRASSRKLRPQWGTPHASRSTRPTRSTSMERAGAGPGTTRKAPG